MKTLTQCYSDTFFGDISYQEALEAMHCHAIEGRSGKIAIGGSDECLEGHDYVLGHCVIGRRIDKHGREISPAKTARYLCPNLYSAQRLRLMNKEQRQSFWNTRKYSTPLLALPTVVYFEIDGGDLVGALAHIDAVEAETGIRPNVVCLSGDMRPESIARTSETNIEGGKSPHQFISLDRPIEWDEWQHLQRLAVLVYGGDTAMINIGQLARMPGVIGPNPESSAVRLQTCLRAERRTISPDTLRAALEAYLEARGIDATSKRKVSAQISQTRKTNGQTVKGGRTTQAGFQHMGRLELDTLKSEEAVPTPIAELVRGLPGGDSVKCFCPYHTSTSGVASASVKAMGEGRYLLTCFGGCGASWTIDHSRGVTPPKAHLDIAGLELNLGERKATKYIEHRPFTAKLTIQKSGKGSGKTEQAARAAKATKGRVVVVAHRRALVEGLATRFGVPSYRDLTGNIVGSVAICIDSMPRIKYLQFEAGGEIREEPIELLIIDEAQQVLEALRGGQMDGYGSLASRDALREAVRRALRIIGSDADIGPEAIAILKKWAGAEPEIREVPVDMSDTTLTHYTEQSMWYSQWREKWVAGERLAIATMQGPRQAQSIARQMKKLRPDAEVLVVSSEDVYDLPFKLGEINEHITRYDAIVYTPTLGTGVSIDVKGHFDSVFIWGARNVGTAMDLDQMAHRVRHPKQPNIYAYVQPGTSRPTIDPTKIAEEELAKAKGTYNAIKKVKGQSAPYPLDDDGQPINREWFKEACLIASWRRKWGAEGGDLAAACVDYWIAKNYRYVKVTEGAPRKTRKAIATARAEALQEVDTAYARAVAGADDVDIEVARDREPETKVELYENEKASLSDFYGGVTIGAEEVMADERGKRRAKLSKLANLILLWRGRADILAGHDQRTAAHGSLVHGDHTLKTAQGFDLLFKAVPELKSSFASLAESLDLKRASRLDESRQPSGSDEAGTSVAVWEALKMGGEQIAQSRQPSGSDEAGSVSLYTKTKRNHCQECQLDLSKLDLTTITAIVGNHTLAQALKAYRVPAATRQGDSLHPVRRLLGALGIEIGCVKTEKDRSYFVDLRAVAATMQEVAPLIARRIAAYDAKQAEASTEAPTLRPMPDVRDVVIAPLPVEAHEIWEADEAWWFGGELQEAVERLLAA